MANSLSLTSKDFGYVIFDIHWQKYVEQDTLSRATKHLLKEFEGLKKNATSHKYAMEMWIGQCRTQGIICTEYDIQMAYDIAYGDGCEWEWEYE